MYMFNVFFPYHCKIYAIVAMRRQSMSIRRIHPVNKNHREADATPLL